MRFTRATGWPSFRMRAMVTAVASCHLWLDQTHTGAFIRRWAPELAVVQNSHLQTPWTLAGAKALAYPPPIVGVAEAAHAARMAERAVRKDPGFRGDAARVVEKHASRKDPQVHFADDQAARHRNSASDLLSFGF